MKALSTETQRRRRRRSVRACGERCGWDGITLCHIIIHNVVLRVLASRSGLRACVPHCLRAFFLLPLDGCWWFAADVVDDAVYASHFVDDAAADASEDVVRNASPVGGHEVLGFDGADGDGAFVGTAIAHHAHALHGQKHGKNLACAAIEICGDDLFKQNLIGIAQDREFVARDFSEHANGKAWAWEGVAPDERIGKAEYVSKLADFIFKELAQGLDELET